MLTRMLGQTSWRRGWLVLAATGVAVAAGCSGPVSKSYEVHTGELSCEQANHYVHDTMLGMKMIITGFKLAKPGTPGYVRGKRSDGRGTTSGEVRIRCDVDGVHIVADSSGVGASQHEFERGIFLGVIGRGKLTVERKAGQITGLVKQEATGSVATGRSSAGSSAKPHSSGNTATSSEEVAAGVSVVFEPVHGFSTVLDFDADLSAAGILPVKVSITNGTKRVYEFDPSDIALREAGSRRRAYPLSASAAVERLLAYNRGMIAAGSAQPSSEVGPVEASAPSELGDVRAASRIIRERRLRGARLRPRDRVTGFLYYQVGNYDRARITLIDSATGETEGFIVEF